MKEKVVVLTALVAGRAVDLTMSVIAFGHGAAELNPVARGAWESGGVLHLVALQVVGVTALTAIYMWMPIWKRIMATLLIAGSWLPVALNTAIITGLLRV